MRKYAPCVHGWLRFCSVRVETMSANVFGIGYEGLALEDFIQDLQDRGVMYLVDVRLNPISRKKGF